LVFQSFDRERACWWLFQKYVDRIKLDIYVLRFFTFIINGYSFHYMCAFKCKLKYNRVSINISYVRIQLLIPWCSGDQISFSIDWNKPYIIFLTKIVFLIYFCLFVSFLLVYFYFPFVCFFTTYIVPIHI
jgi:hypothetical protein